MRLRDAEPLTIPFTSRLEMAVRVFSSLCVVQRTRHAYTRSVLTPRIKRKLLDKLVSIDDSRIPRVIHGIYDSVRIRYLSMSVCSSLIGFFVLTSRAPLHIYIGVYSTVYSSIVSRLATFSGLNIQNYRREYRKIGTYRRSRNSSRQTGERIVGFVRWLNYFSFHTTRILFSVGPYRFIRLLFAPLPPYRTSASFFRLLSLIHTRPLYRTPRRTREYYFGNCLLLLVVR